MIRARLIDLFGDDTKFTNEIAHQMKKLMLSDLKENRYTLERRV
jgi:hypothetical protein